MNNLVDLQKIVEKMIDDNIVMIDVRRRADEWKRTGVIKMLI